MTEQFNVAGQGEELELSDLLEAMAQMIRIGMRVHVPARVVAYDAATQLAVVQCEHRLVVRVSSIDRLPPGAELQGSPPNAKAVLPPKVVQDIPVIFPGTSTAYLTVPIAAGTTGTLHVHDRALDQWMLKGAPCDPLFAWTSVLESSEFHPGLHPKTAPITPATDLTATVVEGPLVKVGRLATEAMVKADTLIAVLDAAWSAATPSTGDGGTNLKSTFLTSWNGAKDSIKSTKGLVE